MSYQDQWNALSTRIRGLIQVTQHHTASFGTKNPDGYGGDKSIGQQGSAIVQDLLAFGDRFHSTLPPEAHAVIDRMKKDSNLAALFDNPKQPGTVAAGATKLATFESEMSYLLTNLEEPIRTVSERAFAHLQRSIVADEEVRKKWQKAFASGEEACEKLGAVHLLLHGIWAFKVKGKSAITDLVFQEPVSDLTSIERYANGLVLTEWKIAKTESEASRRFQEARAQADLYASGVLGATELKSYRFLVVVSDQAVTPPDDLRQNGVVHRHINIAVARDSPSREAKRIRRSSGPIQS